MSEKIIGIIKNVQAKGNTSLTMKTCDIVITDKRLVCVVLGGSTWVSGMIGQAVAGASTAIAYATATQLLVDDKRFKNKGKELDNIVTEGDNYQILWKDVTKLKYKTVFFSTLGMWAPLTIYADKRYFFNIPNKEKHLVKEMLEIVGKI